MPSPQKYFIVSISLVTIVAWLLRYKYAVLFPIAVVEGPIITVIGGFLAAHQYLNIFAVYVIVVIADMAGDWAYYLIGQYGGAPFLKRWGKYLGVATVDVEKLRGHFSAHAGKTLVLAKITQVASAPVLVAGGMVKMPLHRFLGFVFLGELPKTLILLLVGYYFGAAYQRINNYFDYATLITLGIFIVLVIAYRVWAKCRHPIA